SDFSYKGYKDYEGYEGYESYKDYKNENYGYDNYTLYNEPLTPTLETNTKVNIATAINNILIEFNLINKVLALTINNVSAMLVCGKTLADTAHHGLEIIEQEITEPLEKATKLLSATSYLTIADVRFVFSSIQEYLQDYIDNDIFSHYLLALSINEKISEYETIIDNVTTIAIILDPQTKLSLFEIEARTTNAINRTREVFDQYITTSNKLTNVLSNSIKDVILTTCDYFCELK
ncbi:3114_t:CDS:2, partial [Cetraspora pellucida]